MPTPNPGQKAGMFALRTLLALVVAAALALSGTVAVARTVHGPMTDMVICADGGMRTVRLDVQGNPVDPGQCGECPDCLAPVAGLPGTAGLILAIDTVLPVRSVPARLFQPATQRHLRPAPRGPPPVDPTLHDRLSQVRLSLATLEFGQVRRGKARPLPGQTIEVAR